jgi:hypothetical protein
MHSPQPFSSLLSEQSSVRSHTLKRGTQCPLSHLNCPGGHVGGGVWHTASVLTGELLLLTRLVGAALLVTAVTAVIPPVTPATKHISHSVCFPVHQVVLLSSPKMYTVVAASTKQ